MSRLFEVKEPEFKEVRISTKWLRQRTMCSEEFIATVCGGRCCQASDGTFLCSLLPSEEVVQNEKYGLPTEDGKLLADPETKICPHKTKEGFCGIHFTGDKPFGCIASPFTVNKNGTLISRKRYVSMICARKKDSDEGLPYYKAFRAGLELIFGKEEAQRLITELDNGAEELTGKMPMETYKNMIYLDGLKVK